VIVGNPPWSAGQRSSADDNPNVDYPEIERRVAETYAARSTATLKNSLYDTYKMAIRWASDRIGGQGVVAFVTNGSWIDGNVDSGVRACLAEEFTSVWVLDLRGNARTSGQRRPPSRPAPYRIGTGAAQPAAAGQPYRSARCRVATAGRIRPAVCARADDTLCHSRSPDAVRGSNLSRRTGAHVTGGCRRAAAIPRSRRWSA